MPRYTTLNLTTFSGFQFFGDFVHKGVPGQVLVINVGTCAAVCITIYTLYIPARRASIAIVRLRTSTLMQFSLFEQSCRWYNLESDRHANVPFMCACRQYTVLNNNTVWYACKWYSQKFIAFFKIGMYFKTHRSDYSDTLYSYCSKGVHAYI